MKVLNSIISISLFGIILFGCQPQKNDPRLIEAHDYHQQAGKIRESLGQQLSNAEADSLLHSTLEEFKLALKEWDEAFVEVPGFEHDHDHDHDEEGHDHHHHHAAAPNLSAQEHLDLQKHLLDEIKELEKSFNEQLIGLKN
jgi:ABC-type nickel/cobalt efflux system permease component RcnA